MFEMALLFSNLYTELLVLGATLVGLLIWYTEKCFTFWKKMGVPYVEPSFPFGNAAALFTMRNSFGGTLIELHKKLKQMGHKYGGIYFFARPIFIPIDPEIVKSIMQTDFHKFVDRGMYMNEKADPLGAHLFSLEGTQWRNLRAKLTPTFTSGKMKSMFNTLVQCSVGLEPLIDSQKGEPVDIKDMVRRYTTDVIGSCAFGIECNTLKNPDSEFHYYGNRAFEPTLYEALRAFATFAFPHRLLRKLNVRVSSVDVSNFFLKVVRETVEYREKNNVQRKDFMNLLLQLKNQGKVEDDDEDDNKDDANATKEENGKLKKSELTVDPLTLDQIAAQSFLFYVAGFETSSTTITFCLYELTQRLDVQKQLREEIDEVLQKHAGKITYDAINEMKYMEMVVQETLRLHPPVPTLNRVSNEEYTIPGTDITLPAGTYVFIVNEALQMDPDHFPEPERFDPDRFTEENKATRHPYTHLPFGEGPRHCIGLRFGMMQVKVGLTELLRNYKFTLNSKTKMPITMKKNSFINAVDGDIWLNAEKIRSK